MQEQHHPAPLEPFGGERPPAPAWFETALAHKPERSFVHVEGARIELLTWGERGKPGLLLLHGNGAQAQWWSHIAPFLASEFRVAAPSWSGMGDSDWREAYSPDLFAAEVMTTAEAAGLFEAGPPVFVGHSFGAFPMLVAASRHSERLAGIVSLDSAIRPPSSEWRGPPPRSTPNRVYASLAEALARFRFAPLQACEHPFIADHIARTSLKRAPLADGSGEGWTWKFDPFMWRSFKFEDRTNLFRDVRCPVAMIWGDRSQLLPPDVRAYMRQVAPAGTPIIDIPDADHHVMVDQPLALVAALRSLLAVWPQASASSA